MTGIYCRNWRDFQPKIAHLSAVHWGGLRSVERDSEDDRDRLERLGGFARHALQGRKTSDHHRHESLEQVYYVLSGAGEVLYDGSRYAVEAGDAIYLPSGVHHQMFNDGSDDWLEHHVISQPVDGNGGRFCVRHWRQAAPAGDGGGAVRWRQLGPEAGQGPQACLRGMAFIDRWAVQPRSSSSEKVEEELEQVCYVLGGRGVLHAAGSEQEVTEGDMVHLPPGTRHGLQNPHDEWVTCLVMAA